MTLNYNSSSFPAESLLMNIDNKYFERLSLEFGKYHKDPMNVLFHLLTTPLGVVGALSIVKNLTGSSSIGITLTFMYLLNLSSEVPTGIFIGSVMLIAIVLHLVRKLRLGWISSFFLVGLGYVLQDMSHLATGEKTFQSTYSAGGSIDLANPVHWFSMLMEHVYYLIPLVVHVTLPFIPSNRAIESFMLSPVHPSIQHLQSSAWFLLPLIIYNVGSYCLDSLNGYCFFPGAPYFCRLLRCNIANTSDSAESRQDDLKTIRDWTLAHNPSKETSSHWWFKDLKGSPAEAAFKRCAESSVIMKMFRDQFNDRHYNVDIVEGMNEIYVTGPCRLGEINNSDQVFFSRHVDGPMALIPFVSVYRCIVGMDRNLVFTTHFPLANKSVNACNGDVLAFDFNRELHYITADDSKKDEADEYRVTLKLHYSVYPKVLSPLGWFCHWCNVRYNRSFRALFLRTIKPSTLYEHFLAWNVNFATAMFNFVETYFGQRNVIYIAFVGALWYATGRYEVFFALTSVLHYFRYITTYYVRRDIDFGSFKRDVLLFKTLALIQLFYHYFFPKSLPFAWDWISISMILIGYSVSVMATNALGIDRTYFGAELGLLPPKWITQFPYGYIPHPMIVSQVFALLGLHKAAHFRADWPYVIPVHVALYMTHMLQEHFDIYRKDKSKEIVADKLKTM